MVTHWRVDNDRLRQVQFITHRLGVDHQSGEPYPTEVAAHPGIRVVTDAHERNSRATGDQTGTVCEIRMADHKISGRPRNRQRLNSNGLELPAIVRCCGENRHFMPARAQLEKQPVSHQLATDEAVRRVIDSDGDDTHRNGPYARCAIVPAPRRMLNVRANCSSAGASIVWPP
jgi:hypothetical protein